MDPRNHLSPSTPNAAQQYRGDDAQPSPASSITFQCLTSRYLDLVSRTTDLEIAVCRLTGEAPTPLTGSGSTRPDNTDRPLDDGSPLISRLQRLDDALMTVNARMLTALDRLNSFV